MINKKLAKIWHGCDYNPDQWLKYPEILEKDITLMKKAGINVVSVGIFSWAVYEKEEGVFTFEWMDKLLDRLYDNQIFAILATPSGARPPWMAQKYPEVLRTSQNRVQNIYGGRHNHCFTSPIYRDKANEINKLLAIRYGNHPAILLWHVSNELGGSCHCPLCQSAFQDFLKQRYKTLENLNDKWWGSFWSHNYTDWTQIESHCDHGETDQHMGNIEWNRFTTNQTIDFLKEECKPLRQFAPNIPITTNLMCPYTPELNLHKLVKELDVIAFDTYPYWHNDKQSDWDIASKVAFENDLYRSLGNGKPFIQMEATPSLPNWHTVNKIKKPGMHILSSLLMVSQGVDSIQYFQWRQGRGSNEKFHGAIVSHEGSENSRVFREIAELSNIFSRLTPVLGSRVTAEVAIIFDWENMWGIDNCKALHSDKKHYAEMCIEHYKSFLKMNIAVNVIDQTYDISKYKLVVAPMLYMLRGNFAEKLEKFVANGGEFVTTYWSGIVDEYDLCFLGGFPGPLRKLLGIWSEEIDTLYDNQYNSFEIKSKDIKFTKKSYQAHTICDIIHTETASVEAVYGADWYKDKPALTKNIYKKGKAWYIASRSEEDFKDDLYTHIAQSLSLKQTINTKMPSGVIIKERTDGENNYIFILNFNDYDVSLKLGISNLKYISGINIKDSKIKLSAYKYSIFQY